ncbi:MAG: sulfatase [Anaerolineales bacterium]|nr:MAG: sulfatase [Anaerolineales bacterium]
MNIILMVFDSLRRDCLGVYGSPPWWRVNTPHFDAFAAEALVMTRAFPESLPTLPARRALYTGQRTYPFDEGNRKLKGDWSFPGWGPIPEEQTTLAEVLQGAGYRTALIADLYHMFKPSKNFWRGFDQWTFLRGQEKDPARSGPRLTQAEIDYWLPKEKQNDATVKFIQQAIMNIRDRTKEEDYFAPRVLKEAALWLEQNQDAAEFYLVVESFDPHEPWLVPGHYRRMYLKEDGQEQVISGYEDLADGDQYLLARTRANYSGAVTMCDRWFGYLMETLRVLDLLDNTMVIVTADHGHSLGEGNYIGKRGYPSAPEVLGIPLMVRFPGAQYAGKSSGIFVQHHDIPAAILEATGVEAPEPLDGRPFLRVAVSDQSDPVDHVTVGWGSAVTVVTRKWWFNCKVDGTGVLLHDLEAAEPFANNVAAENGDLVRGLYARAVEDAGGRFADWLIEHARTQADAPGCSPLVVTA